MKIIEDSKDFHELAVLKNQIEEVRLKEKLAKRKFNEKLKKVFEPITKSLGNTSQDLTKAIVESFIESNKALEHLNNKFLEKMNDRGILASYLMSPLSEITNPENANQFRLVKDSSSNRVIDLKIHSSILFTLHDNFLFFRDTGKEFELKGDILKLKTIKNYNVDLASLQDKKLMYDFAEELNFDIKAQGVKSTRDRTLIELLKPPAIVASQISTIFLSSDPDEL